MDNDQTKRRIILAVQRILDDALPSNQEDDRTDADAEETTAAALDPDIEAGYAALRKDLSDLWKSDWRAG